MESNIPAISKRVLSNLRVALFMLRKGISKGKLMMDLNLFLKRRGKLAGKAITNLMFHHGGGGSTSTRSSNDVQFAPTREYEFSCSNTPNYNFFPIGHKRQHHRHNNFFACAHAPSTKDDDVMTVNAVKAVLEMLNNNNNNNEVIVEASPALPGFGRSPAAVRQLRVTDSPFPLRNADDDKDNHVDKAAEEFIKRFYSELRNQA